MIKFPLFEKNLYKSSIFDYEFIYIYSDLRYYLIKFGSNFSKYLINLFLKEKKTLIIPTFSYTTSGRFLINKTESKLGYLSNFILNSRNSYRSDHPLFSFAAIGPKKKILNNLGKSAFGSNGLHRKLYKKNVCYLHMGRPLKQGNTMVHFFEQKYNVAYRYEKKFLTKVYRNKKYLGTNYSAYLRRLNKKNNYFYFAKAYKEIKKRKFVKSYCDTNQFQKVEIYSYDRIYETFDELIEKDKNIFIRK